MPEVEKLDSPIEELGVDTLKQQSVERQQIANKLASRFYIVREMRDRPYKFFRDRSFLEYTSDSLDRINQYKARPAYKKWWQSNLAGPTTRNKLIAILSKLAAQAMEPRVISVNDTNVISKLKERVSNYLLKAAGIRNQDDRQMIWEMFEGGAKGTVCGFEGWKIDKRKVRTIIDEDPETGKVKFEEQEIKFWNDVKGELIPIEDIYFGDIFVSFVQDMDDIFWRQILSFDDFKNQFGKYSDANLVSPAPAILGAFAGEEGDVVKTYSKSSQVGGDEIEVLRYFNKATDEYMILANGIWINPIGKSTVAPLPFNHKKLPFWVAPFEIIDSKFIYGKSLADKMISTQDTSDKTIDSVLDRLVMALKSPIVVQGAATSLTNDYLEPDNVIEFNETTGLEKVSRLDLQEPGPMSLKILEYLGQEMANTTPETSVKDNGRKTATEAQIERESALEIVSLFLRLMEFGIREKYILRLQNIFQFYSLPSHKLDKDSKFSRIVLRNEILPDGSMGIVNLSISDQVTSDTQEMTEREKSESPEPLERIVITRDFIRNFEADIMMVPRSSVRQSEALRQAQEIRFVQTAKALFPNMINEDALFQDWVAKYPDKDISRLRVKKSLQAGQGNSQIPGAEENQFEMPTKEQPLRELVA